MIRHIVLTPYDLDNFRIKHRSQQDAVELYINWAEEQGWELVSHSITKDFNHYNKKHFDFATTWHFFFRRKKLSFRDPDFRRE
jgi:hypothetical protein